MQIVLFALNFVIKIKKVEAQHHRIGSNSSAKVFHEIAQQNCTCSLQAYSTSKER
jgi:hypothetical protein